MNLSPMGEKGGYGSVAPSHSADAIARTQALVASASAESLTDSNTQLHVAYPRPSAWSFFWWQNVRAASGKYQMPLNVSESNIPS